MGGALMPHRPATVTQADVARTIRAVKATGEKIVRIVVRPDGVAIETVETAPPMPAEEQPPAAEPPKQIVL
jgi:hypothetical protein